MPRTVEFVTLDLGPRIMPLAGTFLQGYATRDPELADTWSFHQYVSMPSLLTADKLLTDLAQAAADVYAFSCYDWNMRLVREVLPGLLRARPESRILLGGPQVMRHAERYLDPEAENLALCNGEGEKTFRNYLAELQRPEPDLSRVRGLSFFRRGELVTTEAEERIKDLDEIPSPFLNGLIDPGLYDSVFLETTRGCSFTCSYCHWGAAIGSALHRFSTERVRRDLEWLASNGVSSIAFVDANWGILPRDVELSRYLTTLKAEHDAPALVGFCASKNTPDRVAEITKIFHQADMLLSHTISLQTMSPTALRKAGRTNMPTPDYLAMQSHLNERGVSTHIELIWPLPGETLESFVDGLGELCAGGADAIICYPLYYLHNTGLEEHREEWGLVTRSAEHSGGESEIVVGTKEVPVEDCLEGWRYTFAALLLHNLRSFYYLPRYLVEAGFDSYPNLLSSFVRLLHEQARHPLAQLVEEAAQAMKVDAFTVGPLALYTYTEGTEFNALLARWVAAQPWWQDDEARFWFEVDVVNCPLLFAGRPEPLAYPFRHLKVSETSDGYLVEVAEEHLEKLATALGRFASFSGNPIDVGHGVERIAFDAAVQPVEHWVQCFQSALTMAKLSPTWADGRSPVSVEPVDAALARSASEILDRLRGSLSG